MPLPRPESGWVNWTEGYRGAYEDIDPPQGLPCRKRSFSWTAVLGGFAFCAAGLWAASTVHRPGRGLVRGSTNALGPSDFQERGDGRLPNPGSIGVRVSNEYQNEFTPSKREFYPWTHMAEPHRMTTIEVVNWPKEELGDYPNFRWTVDGNLFGSGAVMETTFERTGLHQCSVTGYRTSPPDALRRSPEEEEDADEDRIGRGLQTRAPPAPPEGITYKFSIAVKYVRRELRELTDRDRETFFNAAAIIQRVPSAIGRQIYGNKYYSKDYFNRLHLYYGGRKDCDHWHDGAGFVTSHISVSLMFEQTLQSINPSIALPYWDFTIEGTFYDWSNFRTSPIFSDDWFGTATPENMFRVPDKGRFGYVSVMTNATEYSELYNSYGMLKAPWNSDPTPFVTRHTMIAGYPNNRKPSGCKEYRDAVKQDSWMSLTESMNAGAHGHIHELLGGTWSTDLGAFADRTTDIIDPFTHVFVPLLKYLWRSDVLQCPQTCGTELAWKDCKCTCQVSAMAGKTPSEIIQESGAVSGSIDAFFYDQDLKLVDNLTDAEGHLRYTIPGYSKDKTSDIYAELLHVLCTPMKIGTHYEGTSTNDLTFWVLHPSFDRVWHLTRLQDKPGFNSTWTASDECYGHNPTDVQPFHDLFDTGGTKTSSDPSAIAGVKSYHTNEELYQMLQPDGFASPYIYDHFEWPHCDAQGIFMHN